MDYKALIFDLDGTAIPNQLEGLPTKRVIRAISEAKKHLKVCAATGRPISNSHHLLEMLNLESPCVISGGTRIVNPKTKEILWEKKLSEEQVYKIIDICKPYHYPIFLSDELESRPAKLQEVKGSEYILYVEPIPIDDVPDILKKLDTIPNLAIHEATSWTKDHIDLHITHADATKKHAIEVLLKMLDVKKEEVIGVGDSDNDLPLFASVGYKVAMGNATERLKQEADYVASSVDEDGLVAVIEKFILPTLP